MNLFDLIRRILTGAPKPGPKRRFERLAAGGEVRHDMAWPTLELEPPTERPAIPARVIDVKGTYGRNAVEPLPKRRRR